MKLMISKTPWHSAMNVPCLTWLLMILTRVLRDAPRGDITRYNVSWRPTRKFPLASRRSALRIFLHIDNNGSTRDLTGLELRVPVTVRTTNALQFRSHQNFGLIKFHIFRKEATSTLQTDSLKKFPSSYLGREECKMFCNYHIALVPAWRATY